MNGGPTLLAQTTSGDNPIAHTFTAATVGGALSAFGVWGLQLLHADPPASIDQALTVICTVIASIVMRKLLSS